jgi:hypothetical protein
MDEPLEEVYFNWLYSKVVTVQHPTHSSSYWTLLRDLHSIEFVWLISGDDNRAEEGLEVRREFYRMIQLELDEEIPWMNLGCSVLEMLLGFARRAEFQTEIPTQEWFWIMLHNLGLDELNDAVDDIHIYVSEALDKLIWRMYDRKGRGGLFPLNRTKTDQRDVEIWYQFCEYLVDQEIC